jgi:hypothetical protein
MSIEADTRATIKQQFLDTLPDECKRKEEGLPLPVVCKNAARLACTIIDVMSDGEEIIETTVANYAKFVSGCPGLEHVGTSCVGRYVCQLDGMPCFGDAASMREQATKLIPQT